jgi:hypothetical protein
MSLNFVFQWDKLLDGLKNKTQYCERSENTKNFNKLNTMKWISK